VARIGTSLLAAAALWLLRVFFRVFFCVGCAFFCASFSVSFRFTPVLSVVHRQRRTAATATLPVHAGENLGVIKYERLERRQGSIVAPMATKPTLPDGMCLPTGKPA